jgi:hypothetical protein
MHRCDLAAVASRPAAWIAVEHLLWIGPMLLPTSGGACVATGRGPPAVSRRDA